jgi:hypothetical protein
MPTNQSPTRRFTGYNTGQLVLLSLTLTTVPAATAACVDNQLAGGYSSTPPAASNASAATPTTSSATPTPAPATPTSQETNPRDHPPHHRRRPNRHRRAQRHPDRSRPRTPAAADHHPRRLQQRREGRRTTPTPHHGRGPRWRRSEINDIGYYQPSNGLVFYYGDVGYFNGIVRIGSLSAADMELIRSQTGNFTINIEEA